MSIGSFGTNLTPIATGISVAAGSCRMGGTTNLTVTGNSVAPSFLADAISNGSVGLLGSGLTFTRASGATQRDFAGVMNPVLTNELRFDGYRRVQNLYTATATLATQNTTVTAQNYTVSFTGTGTITFSGAATGSLVGQGAGVRVAATITCTSGTLTSTVTGSCTSGQLETGNLPSEYVSVGTLSSPYYGAFVDGVQYFSYQNGNTVVSNVVVPASGAAINPTTTLKGILIEEARTNYFLNSTAPVTQTISLAIGTYVCWIYGTGSMTSSAGTATATGYGAATNTGSDWYTSNTFTTLNVTVAGTVVFTLAGSVTFAQVEGISLGVAPTSPIITAGASATRAQDTLTSGLPGGWVNASGTLQCEFIAPSLALSSYQTMFVVGDNTLNNRLFNYIQNTTAFADLTVAGTAEIAANIGTYTKLTIARAAVTYGGTPQGCFNAGTVATGSGTAVMASPTGTTYGANQGGVGTGYLNGWLRKVRYFNSALTTAQLQTVTGSTY